MTEHNNLKKQWENSENLVDVGKIIFENILPDNQPHWAKTVLNMCYSKIKPLQPIEELLVIIDDPEKWALGHDCFDQIRKLTLKVMIRKRVKAVLYLAEIAAKVTYNASNPSDPFDADSGWWMASNAKYLSGLVKDKEFDGALWNQLTDPHSTTKGGNVNQ